MGGEHDGLDVDVYPCPGSSPRGRGTRLAGSGPRDGPRVIPAWAGNTHHKIKKLHRFSGHPRVGGEHSSSARVGIAQIGSSPRGRGTRRSQAMPPDTKTGHPRVGGEHIDRQTSGTFAIGSSPRGRGTRAGRRRPGRLGRVIPAWAGNTYTGYVDLLASPGHPRVGGEHIPAAPTRRWTGGSSPRGRGTHLLQPYDCSMLSTTYKSYQEIMSLAVRLM